MNFLKRLHFEFYVPNTDFKIRFFAYLYCCVAFHYSHHHFKNNKREFNLLLIYYKIADSKSVSEWGLIVVLDVVNKLCAVYWNVRVS